MSKNTPPHLEKYDPAPGFWRPYGRKAKDAVRDTAESTMEVQEYRPPRKQKAHPESLPIEQRYREAAFMDGKNARLAGRGRESSHWHRIKRVKRARPDDICLAAFEQGWDVEDRIQSSNSAAS